MRKSKFAAMLALLLVICLCLGACTGSQTTTEKNDITLPEPESAPENQFVGEGTSPTPLDVTLHYASEGSLSLGTTQRRINLRPGDSAVHAILSELTTSASLSDAVEAEITAIESGSGVVTVNLGIEAGVNRSQQDYLLLCASIANTLLELDSVSAVNILTGSRSDPLCDLPMGVFSEKKDNIAALYAQVQSESESRTPFSRNALIYFPAEDSAYFLPELRQLDFSGEDYVSPLLEALSSGPLMRTCCFSAIPPNMDLLSSAAEILVMPSGERIIELHFDSALTTYLAFSNIEESQLYGSLVLTLCSFIPEIDGLRIRIGEETVSGCSLNGTNLRFDNGVMRRQDFAPYIGGSADIFFTREAENLIRSEKALSQGAAVSPLHILRQQVSATVPEGLASVFPEGIRSEDILGIHIENRTAIVNLSAGFYARCQNLSARQERLLIYAMVNTLTQLDEIGAVSFLAEGRQLETLAQNIYLKTPLLPDHGLISAAQ